MFVFKPYTLVQLHGTYRSIQLLLSVSINSYNFNAKRDRMEAADENKNISNAQN